MKYCKCGAEVPEKRVEFLKKFNKPITCLECSTTQKVGGFVSTESKTERPLIIAEPGMIAELRRLDKHSRSRPISGKVISINKNQEKNKIV